MRKITVLLTSTILVLSGCNANRESQENSDNKQATKVVQVKENQNLNLSVFIDLSDRISPINHPNPTMEYSARDIGYINSLAGAFENHMLHKKIILMNDRIQVFIDPPPPSSEINEIIRELRMNFDKNNITKERIESLGTTYTENTSKLYELAIADNKYIGSDIWGFFKSKIKDYCISDQHRNVLVIITDGYIYHKDNKIDEENRSSYLTTISIAQHGLNTSSWSDLMEEKDYGFLVQTTELDNLEVLVLGINAYKKSPYEEDVIRRYWSDWLTNMGVAKFAIKAADLPSNLDEVIQKFILVP